MSLRSLERESIQAAVRAALHDGLLRGRVLDYGSGRQPYRNLLEAGGCEYAPYDSPRFPASVAVEDDSEGLSRERYDAVLCTQVIQYTPSPERLIAFLHGLLKLGGWLVMTGPTNWPIVEQEDLWRFTPQGVAVLLSRARFRNIEVSERASVAFEGERWAIGWAAKAQA